MYLGNKQLGKAGWGSSVAGAGDAGDICGSEHSGTGVGRAGAGDRGMMGGTAGVAG